MLGEELECAREIDNMSDPYAVAVKKTSIIVGHIQRRISADTFCKRMALQLAAKSQAQGATPLIYSREAWKYHVFWSFQVILKILLK